MTAAPKPYAAKVVSLRVVRDRTVRYSIPETRHGGQAAALAGLLIGECPHENLLAILVDPNHKVLGVHYAAIGGLSRMSVAVRDVFRAAIACNAAAVILAHNHPSGDPTPSEEDLAFTRNAIRAGELLGTPILDHVVVSGGPFVSMLEAHARLWEKAT